MAKRVFTPDMDEVILERRRPDAELAALLGLRHPQQVKDRRYFLRVRRDREYALRPRLRLSAARPHRAAIIEGLRLRMSMPQIARQCGVTVYVIAGYVRREKLRARLGQNRVQAPRSSVVAEPYTMFRKRAA